MCRATLKISTIVFSIFKVMARMILSVCFFLASHIWLLIYKYYFTFSTIYNSFSSALFVIHLIALFVFTMKWYNHIVLLYFLWVESSCRLSDLQTYDTCETIYLLLCFSSYKCSSCQKYALCAPTLRGYFYIVTCIVIHILPFAYTELIILWRSLGMASLFSYLSGFYFTHIKSRIIRLFDSQFKKTAL